MKENVIHCTNCGRPNVAEARYCVQCGSAIAIVSPRSGKRKAASQPVAAPAFDSAPPARAGQPATRAIMAWLERVPIWAWLAALGLALILSYFAFSGGQKPTATGEAPRAEATVPSAALVENVAPTAQDLPPTPTEAQPPVPGWQLFATDAFSIWLPEGFMGGDTVEDMQRLVRALRSAGREGAAVFIEGEYGPMERMQAGETEFYAANRLDPSLTDTVEVERYSTLQDLSWEERIESFRSAFDPEYFELGVITDFSLPGYEDYVARVLLLDGSSLGITFFLMQGDTIWQVSIVSDFESGISENDAMNIVQSFEAH